jgi:hypothetical protein
VLPATVGIITTVAGNGNPLYTGDGFAAVNATLSTPSGVAVDGAGNVYIADTGNNVIRKIVAATGIITTIVGNAGNGGAAGYGGDGHLATDISVELNYPKGVTLDAYGNLYIADTLNHRIRKVDVATGIITTVAGNGFTNSDGTGGYSGDNGPATAAELNFPYAVGFDPSGNMYIPDSANNRVRMVDLTGKITTFAGTGYQGDSGDGYAATLAQLFAPLSVAIDPAGNVYIADTQNNAIRKVSGVTKNISTVALNADGEYLYNGTFSPKELHGPEGLALDGSADLYLADSLNMQIREMQSNFVAIDLTQTPVRQGSTSVSTPETVENDGNAPLDLTSIVPDQNAATGAGTTCTTGSPYMLENVACVIGAVFAPSPSVPPTDPESGNIDIGKTGDTANAPLDIQVIGDATLVNSTTVVVTSSLNPSDFGQSVIFTATVTTGAGTGNLTGTVSFFDGANTLKANVALLAPGITAMATFTTSALTVGTHQITASYNGDLGHFANVSAPALPQVVDEVTTTGLTPSANPSALGASVTFTATVTISGGGGVTPDGSVTFYDGANLLQNVPLNGSSVATYSTTTLTNGVHSITAVYGGDTVKDILGSTSSPVLSQDIQASGTASVTSNDNPSTYGDLVTFTATVTTTGTVTPTGVVKFFDGVTQIGTGTLDVNGQTTLQTSSLIAGRHSITVTYPGDPNNGPSSSSPPYPQVVNKATPAITWATPAAITYGTPLSSTQLDATSGGVAGGFVYTPAAGAILAAGTPTLSVTFTPTDTTDYESVTTTVTLNVNQATPSLSVHSNGTPSSFGGSVIFTATASSGITGTVTFLDGGSPIGTGTLTGTTATFTTTSLAVGPHNITASWPGNSNYNPITSSIFIQTVNKANSVIVWATPAAITYGTALSGTQLDASTTTTPGAFSYSPALGAVLTAGPQTLTATFTPTDTTDYNTVNTTVTLTVNKATAIITWAAPAAINYGTALSGVQLDATVTGGTGTLTYNPAAGAILGAGPHTLSVTFNPTDTVDYNTVNDSVQLTVNKATPTLFVVSSGSPSNYGGSVTFTATISAGPTGTVTFLDGGNSIGTGAIAGTTATFTITTLTMGTHTITVSWPGNGNYNSVTSISIPQVVNATPTTTTVIAVPPIGIAGTTEAITATVRVVGGSAAITGSVTFVDGSTNLGTATVGAGGVATINPMLAAGNHSIVATYSGDHNDNSSVSVAYPLTVVLATTQTVMISSTPNPALVLQGVTFIAKVTGNGGIPTGQISFLADGISMGTAPVDNTGTATFNYSALTAGTHSITASYLGDINDSPSVSGALSQVIGTIPTVTALGVSTTNTTPPQLILVATVLGSGGPVPTGTITFSNGSTVIGAATLDSGGVATFTPDISTGTYSITAAYGGDALHGPSTSLPVSVTSPANAYDISVNPPSVTMATTQNATVTVTLSSQSGFTDTIGLGCGSLPAAVTCHFSNASPNLPAGGVATVQLTIDTNYPLSGGSSATNSHPGGRTASAAGLLLPFSLFFGWIFWRFRKRHAAVFTTLLVLVLSGAALLVTGCSGTTQISAAPGVYEIQVIGVGTNSNISHYQTVTVTVTQ